MDQSIVLMIIGAAFVAFGFILFVWGHHETSVYREKLMHRYDMREFMTNWPPRWWLKTLHLGGGIALAVGAALAVLGLIMKL
ncbi:MAG: hypothetical protein HYX90_06625 [Chloroflexi bacterium]|nr:hypothetical protein [Chloroflexota bacterium]